MDICSFCDKNQIIRLGENQKVPTFAGSYCSIVFIVGEPVVSSLRQLMIATPGVSAWPRKYSTRDPGKLWFVTAGLIKPRTVFHIWLAGKISRKYAIHLLTVFLFASSIFESIFLLYSCGLFWLRVTAIRMTTLKYTRRSIKRVDFGKVLRRQFSLLQQKLNRIYRLSGSVGPQRGLRL